MLAEAQKASKDIIENKCAVSDDELVILMQKVDKMLPQEIVLN